MHGSIGQMMATIPMTEMDPDCVPDCVPTIECPIGASNCGQEDSRRWLTVDPVDCGVMICPNDATGRKL